MPNLEELPICILWTRAGMLVGCFVGVKMLYTLGVFRKTSAAGLVALAAPKILFLVGSTKS